MLVLTNQESRIIFTKIKNLSSVKLYMYIRGHEAKDPEYLASFGNLKRSVNISQTQLSTVLKELVAVGLLEKVGKDYKSTHVYTEAERSSEANIPLELLEKMSSIEIIENVDWGEEGSERYAKILRIVGEKIAKEEAELLHEVAEIAGKYKTSLYDGYMLLNASKRIEGVSADEFFNMIDVRLKFGEKLNKVLVEIENTFNEVEIRVMKDWTHRTYEMVRKEVARREAGASI